MSLSVGQASEWKNVALALLAIACPLGLGGRPSRNWKRWLPVATVVAVFMVTPYSVFGAYYVYQRSAVFLIPASYIAFDYTKTTDVADATASTVTGAVVYVLAFGLAVAALAQANRAFATFRKNDRDFESILAAMKENKSVLSLVFDRDSAFAFSPAYLHFASYYQAEKLGIVAPSFFRGHSFPDVLFQPRGAVWPVPDEWSPESFNWKADWAWRYDYFLVHSEAPRAQLFAGMGGAPLIARRGAWQLYGWNER
jgi:hypothetical protein